MAQPEKPLQLFPRGGGCLRMMPDRRQTISHLRGKLWHVERVPGSRVHHCGHHPGWRRPSGDVLTKPGRRHVILGAQQHEDGHRGLQWLEGPAVRTEQGRPREGQWPPARLGQRDEHGPPYDHPIAVMRALSTEA